MLPDSPAIPSFDSPVDMLTACHDKIRHFAALCDRLARHTAQHGADEQASTAAAAILRYFTVAAPLHHADEEEDLFPALQALGDDTLTSAMRALVDDHGQLDVLWAQASPWLEAVRQGTASMAPDALAQFASHYVQHAAREEREIFPFASRLSSQTLRDIGRRMAQRRGG